MPGWLEKLTSTVAIGWASYHHGAPSPVHAMLGEEPLGMTLADQTRSDLLYLAESEGIQAGGFFLAFNRALSPEELDAVRFHGAADVEPLPRVPEALSPPAPRYPLFIVGSPRSGTSILTRAILQTGYTGFNEGNFLSLLAKLDTDVETHFQVFGTSDQAVLTAHVSPAALKLRLARQMRDIVEPLYQGQSWLDKTGNPEMISAIPLLRTLWPGAVFIYAKRRAIENITSRLKKFPQHDFNYHCIDWARNMATWQRIRAAQPDLPCLEVDQWDIANAPEATARAIGEFLGLTFEQTDMITETFVNERPQETATGTASRILSLDETGWNTLQREIFRKHCSALMSANRYTEDASYRSIPA